GQLPPGSVVSATGARLTIAATGASLSYQWYQGPLLDFTKPVGRSSPTLLTAPVTAPTQYWVRVSSACGTVSSAVIDVAPTARRRAAKPSRSGERIPQHLLVPWRQRGDRARRRGDVVRRIEVLVVARAPHSPLGIDDDGASRRAAEDVRAVRAGERRVRPRPLFRVRAHELFDLVQ